MMVRSANDCLNSLCIDMNKGKIVVALIFGATHNHFT